MGIKLEEEEKNKDKSDLLRRLNIMSDAISRLDTENNLLKSQIQVLEAQKVQWEAEKIKQQMIIQQSLFASNNTNEQYLQENQSLRSELIKVKERLKELEG